MKRSLFSGLVFPALFVLLGAATQHAAAAPPRPGEIESYREDGTLAQRVEFARSLGNDRFDPELLLQARYKLQRLVLELQGVAPGVAGEVAAAPPPAWQGMPTTGTNKVLCLLVEFQDLTHNAANTQAAVHNALFGNGDPVNAPYESLQNYYKRASYNKLTLTGNTLGWYRTAYARSSVVQTTAGRETLIKEVIDHYAAQGHDFSQYDNDGDGDVDLVYVVYAGADNGWGNFWWAYQTSWQDSNFRAGGKRLAKYVFQFQNYNIANPFTPRVIIHETGHALGLPDYYDYDDAQGPRGGLGRLDMMDGNQGDHNCFSKWVLGWLTPTVVSSGSQTISLRASGTSEDCVLIMPGATTGTNGQFSEFFMAQNRTKVGNDDAPDWPGTGLTIWHIDSTLNGSGQDYSFDNSYTAHKLIRLMEADGLEEIQGGDHVGDGGDYFAAGASFTLSSSPNSRRYDASDSKVSITNISSAGGTMSAQFTITGAGTPPTVAITSPAAGASFSQGSSIAIAANASDDGSVASVSFYGDGAPIGTDTIFPYTATWTNAPTGNHLLTAVATDNTGLTATSAAVAVTVASVGGPGNDNFAARTAITGNTATVAGTNVNASAESGEPHHFARTPQKSVWWRWTPTLTGTATVTTAGSSFDTVLAAYSGATLATLVELHSNDDIPGAQTSAITFAVTAGVAVQLAVDGYNGGEGTVSLNVSVTATGLNNNSFAGATVLSNAVPATTVAGSNAGATAEAGEPLHDGLAPQASVWWKWTAAASGTLEVSTAGSNFDTVLAVYTGATLASLTPRASNDDYFSDATSWVSLSVTSGTVYYIAVDGYAGRTGSITLQTSFYSVNLPPTISLSSPRPGESIGLNDFLFMSAEAHDQDGTVTAVRFYLNNTLVATVASRPEEINYEADWFMTSTGYYTVRATAVDNIGAETSTSTVILVSEIPLPEALDNDFQIWQSGGDEDWTGTDAESHDGFSSAISGQIIDGKKSWFSTTVTGPGLLTYWWSVSSELGFDFLTFYYDGFAQNGKISGEIGWVKQSWTIPAGTHELRWEYAKDEFVSDGFDAGWVDRVEWLTPPQIMSSGAVTSTTGFPLTYEISTDVNADSFAVVSGTLPPGLTLDSDTGIISGAPQTAGIYNVTLRATNAAGSGSKAVIFDIVVAIAIPVAVDAPGLSWSTGGGYWFGQAETSHDGVDAAQNGDIGDESATWMQTQVTGPGTLTFWWRVDSEEDYDFLRLAIDGTEQERASGAVNWVQKSYPVAAGAHTVRWTYDKDESVSHGADSAWVDEVVFTSIGGYAGWKSFYGVTSDTIDGDFDGLLPILEFALGLDPTSSADPDGVSALPVGQLNAAGRLEMQVRLPVNAAAAQGHGRPEVIYEVQVSDALTGWTTIATKTPATLWTGSAIITPGAVANGLQTVKVEAATGLPAITRRFLRMKTSWQP